MAAIRGVRAVVRLAVDYSGTKHEDPEGAMAAFLQVARLASVKGPPGDENAAAAAAHVKFLRAASSALRGPATIFDDSDAAHATEAAADAARDRLRASMSRLLTAEEDADAASQGSMRSVAV